MQKPLPKPLPQKSDVQFHCMQKPLPQKPDIQFHCMQKPRHQKLDAQTHCTKKPLPQKLETQVHCMKKPHLLQDDILLLAHHMRMPETHLKGDSPQIHCMKKLTAQSHKRIRQVLFMRNQIFLLTFLPPMTLQTTGRVLLLNCPHKT